MNDTLSEEEGTVHPPDEKETLTVTSPETEEYFRVAQELSQDGYLVFRPVKDASGKVTDFIWLYENPAAERMNNTTLDKVKGKRLSEVLPHHHLSSVHKAYVEVAETGETRIVEASYEKEDTFNQKTWFRVTARVTRNGDVAVLAQDITALKLRDEAAEALRASEENYRSLFESIDQGFCVIEVLFDASEKPVDYRFLIVNPAFEKQTGIKDAVGRWMKEIAPKHEEHWFQIYGKIAMTGERMQFEHIAEQLHRYYEVSAWRIGEPTERKVAVLFNDLTERKEIEKAVRKSNEEARARAEELEAILDNAPVAIWIAHDPYCHRITGNAYADHVIMRTARGNNISQSAPAGESAISHRSYRNGVELKPQDLPAQQAIATGGPVLPYEMQMIFPNGRNLDLLIGAVPLFDSGRKVRGAVVAGLDISQRKQAEDELRKAKEEADRANQAKDKFLAALSHELRTPLTPILAGAQLLTRREDLPPNVYSTIELIKRNVELEARLIDDLLDLSRVLHGKIQLCKERIDVHRVIKNAVDICRPKVNEKSQELQLYLNAKQTTVEGDISRLQQCFWNLIINSVKFTSEYGRLSIETENQGKDVLIRVNDTGKGIDPPLLPKLFSAFEQGEVGLLGGLGLGLSITKGLIELHHGKIFAFSEGLGKGSTFTITLPALAEAEVEAEKTRFQPEPMSKSILLVEDNEDTGLLMKAILDGGGHRVHFARNVASALKAAENRRFDLLLCDIGLPDGSGLDVVSSLRQRNAIDKAVAMTGYGMIEDVERCKCAGFDTHLTKPVNIEDLERLIAVL